MRILYAGERIPDFDAGDAAEVAVGAPKLVDAVLAANGGNPGVMDGLTHDLSGGKNAAQFIPMTGQLADYAERRRLHPKLDLVYSLREERCGFV
jgi:hypothetical protein